MSTCHRVVIWRFQGWLTARRSHPKCGYVEVAKRTRAVCDRGGDLSKWHVAPFPQTFVEVVARRAVEALPVAGATEVLLVA
jgi:hypothetical protein